MVGVRKMEHLGTSPIKTLKGRKALFILAKTLGKPGVEIANYVTAEKGTWVNWLLTEGAPPCDP